MILYLAKLSYENEEVQNFPDKQKLRDFITTRPDSQELVNGVLQIEMLDSNMNA